MFTIRYQEREGQKYRVEIVGRHDRGVSSRLSRLDRDRTSYV